MRILDAVMDVTALLSCIHIAPLVLVFVFVDVLSVQHTHLTTLGGGGRVSLFLSGAIGELGTRFSVVQLQLQRHLPWRLWCSLLLLFLFFSQFLLFLAY